MAHRDQLGCLLGGANARKPRHLQRISFRILRQLLEYTPLNSHEGMRDCGSFGIWFGRDIHHAGTAFLVVMGEFFHLRSTRISSPAAHSARSGSVIRKALQRASATTSPEPWETSGSM